MQHATTTRHYIATLLVSLAVLLAMAVPATAQPIVTGGLVNVTVVDVIDGDVLSDNEVNLGVALGIAATICDVNVNVLAVQVRDGGAQCESATERVIISQRS